MESTIYTCCICSKPASENCELVHVSPKAVNTLLKSCDIRKASDVRTNIVCDINNVRVHSLCRKVFTDSRRQNTLKRKQASHKEFHTYRLKPIGNNIRASWTKTGKSSKNPIFTIFFTPIYSADFCETFFHGSPTPYEHTQGVSYLQIETNRK